MDIHMYGQNELPVAQVSCAWGPGPARAPTASKARGFAATWTVRLQP